jgi:hypothetical protein
VKSTPTLALIAGFATAVICRGHWSGVNAKEAVIQQVPHAPSWTDVSATGRQATDAALASLPYLSQRFPCPPGITDPPGSRKLLSVVQGAWPREAEHLTRHLEGNSASLAMRVLQFLSDRPSEEVARLVDDVEDPFSIHTLETAISRSTRREGTGRIEALFWSSRDRRREVLVRVLARCPCSEAFYVRCVNELDGGQVHRILLDPRSPLQLLTPESALALLVAAWKRVLHATENRSQFLDLIDGVLARVPLVQDRMTFLAGAGRDVLSSVNLRKDVASWLALDARRAITFPEWTRGR